MLKISAIIFLASTAYAQSSYNGAALLTGSCTTPQLASITASPSKLLAYSWLGCSNEDPGCRPFDVSVGGQLGKCPMDYYEISSACCPLGWSVYTSTLVAGETPCVRSTSLPPPATTSGQLVVNVINTQIFTRRYDLVPRTPDGLSQNAQIGITVGCSVLVALIVTAIWMFIRKRRSHIIERNTFIASAQPGLHGSTSHGALFHVRKDSYQPKLERPEHSYVSQHKPWYPMQQFLAQQSRVPPPRPPRPAVPPSELFGDTYIHEHHPNHSPERSHGTESPFYREKSGSSGHGTQGRVSSMESYEETF